MFTLSIAVAIVGGCASANEPAAPARPSRELAPGVARLRGGGVRMDVELGRTFVQRPQAGGGVTARLAAPVVR